MMHMQDQSNSSLPYSFQQGLGQARPNKKLSQRGKNFQELKICGHGTVLALYRCAQNAFPKVVSELLRRKNKQRVPLLVYVDRRLLRTKFLPLFCSGVVRLAHRKCEVMAQYLVQTAYVRFKVQYEESRAQCGHYVRLLSSTRITL